MSRIPSLRPLAPLVLCALALAACGGDEPAAAPELRAKARAAAVSGVLRPAPATGVDGDVADPAAPYAANDTFAGAQPLPNPVALGGHAAADRDADDVYAARLYAGQALTLHVADRAADLDLYLVDASQQVVDAALDPAARVRALEVPADGDYFVIVRAYAGASTYLLTVDHVAAPAAAGWRLSDPFVAGDAVVRFRGGALREHARATGLMRGREHEIGERNLRVRVDALPVGVIKRGGIGEWAPPSELHAKLDTLLTLKALHHDPDVADVQPNYLYRPQADETDDPYGSYQWQFARLGVADAWHVATGANAVVAVLDSGVMLAHPDLAGQLLPGYDFVRGTAGGGDPGHEPRPAAGSAFHGTHVAGIIGALTDNGVGVRGIAHGARILPVRVCDDTTCPGYAIEQGLRFAAGMPNDSGRTPARSAHVVNLSLGREGGATNREQDLYTRLHERGVTVVAAAGNDGKSARHYPAAYRHVLAVGATDARRVRAPYSNYGSWIDLVAPGGDQSRDRDNDGYPDAVLSTGAVDRDGTVRANYRFMQGTSVAAPHVSATIALMKQVAPGLTPARVVQLLQAGALTDDIGAAGRDSLYGYGEINVSRAVRAARDQADAGPVLVASPAVLDFGATGNALDVTLTNGGGGELVPGTPIHDAGGWLHGTVMKVGGDTVWTYTVDRSALTPGRHAAAITFPSNANAETVPVSVDVVDRPPARLGRQYVLLVDPATFATRYSTVASAQQDGSYTYRFGEVEPGTYLVVAGADHDGDGRICATGEPCGAYRSFSAPELVDVADGDVVDRDVVLEYRVLPDPPGPGLRDRTFAR